MFDINLVRKPTPAASKKRKGIVGDPYLKNSDSWAIFPGETDANVRLRHMGPYHRRMVKERMVAECLKI